MSFTKSFTRFALLSFLITAGCSPQSDPPNQSMYEGFSYLVVDRNLENSDHLSVVKLSAESLMISDFVEIWEECDRSDLSLCIVQPIPIIVFEDENDVVEVNRWRVEMLPQPSTHWTLGQPCRFPVRTYRAHSLESSSGEVFQYTFDDDCALLYLLLLQHRETIEVWIPLNQPAVFERAAQETGTTTLSTCWPD
jgi:hypothetical protein